MQPEFEPSRAVCERKARYTCSDDSGGTLTVWDHDQDAPALLGGKALTRMPPQRAETACAVLNGIEDARAGETVDCAIHCDHRERCLLHRVGLVGGQLKASGR